MAADQCQVKAQAVLQPVNSVFQNSAQQTILIDTKILNVWTCVDHLTRRVSMLEFLDLPTLAGPGT